MTQEEKAQRYDEAIEKLRSLHDDYDTVSTLIDIKEELENIFPELKESEDERIRKAMIDFFKHEREEGITVLHYGVNIERMIAWLEKQGEHANFRNKIQIGDKVTRNEAGILVNISQLNRVAKKREKQGEQKPKFRVGDTIKCKYDDRQFTIKSVDLDKGTYTYTQEGCGNDIDYADEEFELVEQNPTDKVEPKFKVGDWIIFNENHNSIYQVERIDNYRYYMRHYLGGTLSVHFDSELIRLWTIQDAKDGDVLYSPCCKLLWIYKDEKTCHVGSNLNYNSGSIVVNKPICIPTDVHPANKEQRNLLFQKMHEAGYEWDTEKKELKNIEQTPNDEIGNYDHGKVLDALMSAKKTPEPAWSEEDERIIERIDSLLYFQCKIHGSEFENIHVWLKSLKERYTWKPSNR